jgi:hypothetical protein
MADPTAVKDALRALAYETQHETTAHRHVVERAATALGAVDDAAQFCETTGLPALREAVRVADARGETGVARRGRETVSTLLAYRRATGRPSDDDAGTARPDDHFHSGRGTPLSGAGQGGDR